jgi:hypothetical protein
MLLSQLFEKLEPGQRRAIELKIKDAEKEIRKIEDHEQKLDSLGYLPNIPGTEKELEDLKQEYQKYIDELKEKLKQDDRQLKKDPLETYLKAIVRHCPTTVSACQRTGKLLYRGTKETAPAFYGKPFEKRMAKDSNTEYSDAFNYALKQAGAEARRDNSMFCTTNRNFAQGFGHELYIIFPRDPFHFTWSDKVKDLILNSENLGDMIDPTVVEDLMDNIWKNEELKKDVINYFANERGIYPSDVEEYNPLMFNADTRGFFGKYTMYASVEAVRAVLPQMSDEFKAFQDLKLWVSPDRVIKNFGIYIDEDLEGAFKQRFEITVRGEYYAVHSKFEKKVMQFLGMAAKDDDENW